MASKSFMRYGSRVAKSDGRPFILFDLPGSVLIGYLSDRAGRELEVEFDLYEDLSPTTRRHDCGRVAALDLRSGAALRSDGNLYLEADAILEGCELERLLAFLDEHDPLPAALEAAGPRERLSCLAV